MKIAIIDDDQNDREYLITYIKNYGQNHPFPFSIDTISSGELFLKNSMYNEYSIIFVDIYMEGIDGVEIAHTIHSSNKDCLIIFFTSIQDNMWRAIKTHACLLSEKVKTVYLSLEKRYCSCEKFREKFFFPAMKSRVPSYLCSLFKAKSRTSLMFCSVTEVFNK